MIKKIVFFTLMLGVGSDLALAMKELRKQEKLAQKEEKKRIRQFGKRSLKNKKNNDEPLEIIPTEKPAITVESFDVIGKGDNVCVKKNKLSKFFEELKEKKRLKRIKKRVIKRSDVVEIDNDDANLQEVLPDEKEQILALLNKVKEAEKKLEQPEIVENHEELAPVVAPIVPNITQDIKNNRYWACSIVVASVVGGGTLLWVFREKVMDKIKSWFGCTPKEIASQEVE